jgi:hypothetical protein
VLAADTRGNMGSGSLDFTVANGHSILQSILPAAHSRQWSPS